jgi:aryl-alcohol dehydrogenase-like predicted oxidoreductase
VPAAAAAVAAWHAWCGEQGLDTLTAALAVVKSFAAVGFCVVGVDRLQQLEEIAAAWQAARLVAAPALHCDNPAIVDPRRWSAP